MAPQYRPSHIGICVADLDRSLRFYCDGLGFRAEERFELDSDQVPGLDLALEIGERTVVTSQFVRAEGLAIELLAYTTPSPTGSPSASRRLLGLTHLSLYVDDLEAAIAHLVACGGTLLEETRQSPGIDLVFLADPDGVRVELMQLPGA
ncbi:MAG: VOC family protein [Acidimicrobiales bacterium]|nr:VOC family protein [Acidimicrobiales bacterium]